MSYVYHDIAVCCVLQCVAVCCSVLQCVVAWCTACCSVLKPTRLDYKMCHMHDDIAVRGSAWRCIAVCCSVLQCVAVCCSVLRYVANLLN